MKKQKEPLWLMVTRIVLACVFIFSGFTKMVDPVNFGIKIYEYFISFGMGFMHPFSLTIAILAIIAEFTMGVMLLFRIRVKLAALGYLLFMVFFFFLTAWLALAEHLEVHYGYNLHVVKDCGCFGQAIVMSNLETFLKNVAILIVTLIVFAKRNSIPDIRLTSLGQWLLVFVVAGITLLVQIFALRNLPLIDFSNWKKGGNVAELLIEKPAEIDVLFLYQNNKGEEKLLSLEEMDLITEIYPHFYNEYFYIDRIDSVISEAIHAKIQGFSMLDEQGRDFASIYLCKEKVYILFMHDLDETSDYAMRSEALQKLIAYCEENNIAFAGITNSPLHEIKSFIGKYNLTFPIYFNPIDPIKGPFVVRDAIRSNPGLIVLENGIVVKKKSWRNF
ncbi:MAG: DoxX family protein [Lentimicrobiaceae bacterium]|nr:DoxX family protein [Lentimicrobiaceae bacterium]